MADTIYSQLRQSIYTATKSLFPDNKVIIANTNAEEPNGPYVAIRLIRNTQLGTAYVDTLLSAAGKMTTTTNHEALVQFTFTSVDETSPNVAGDMVTYFEQTMETSLTREVFRVNNLSKIRISPIRNVAYKRENVWTECFNIDVTFMFAVRTIQDMVGIETVAIEDPITGVVYTIPPNVDITP
jgi:hypothetical protein